MTRFATALVLVMFALVGCVGQNAETVSVVSEASTTRPPMALAAPTMFQAIEDPLGPVVELDDLPSRGIAIEVREPFVPGSHGEQAAIAVTFTDTAGRLLGHIPGASFSAAPGEEITGMLIDGEIVTLPAQLPDGVGRGWIGYGCADMGAGLESCHRKVSPSGYVPTLSRDGVEILGAAEWVDVLAQRGADWPDDPTKWPHDITETIVGAWASGDHIALNIAAECESRLVAVLSNTNLTYVGAPQSNQTFAGWLDTDRMVFTQFGGCGTPAAHSVVIRNNSSGETVPVLEMDATLNAVVWGPPAVALAPTG